MRILRIALPATVGYVLNGVLVIATNQLLSRMVADATRRFEFLMIDVASQCLYTIVAGYVCAAIAGHVMQLAMAGLIGLGMTVGTLSLLTSWSREPHWYGISLLLVYAPCVWVGYRLRSQHRWLFTQEKRSISSNQNVRDGESQTSIG